MIELVFAASEGGDWSSSGGLADVIGALPEALVKLGLARDAVRPWVFLPLYRQTAHHAQAIGAELAPTDVDVSATLDGRHLRGTVRVLSGAAASGPTTFFVDCPALYDRPGMYHDSSHVDFADNPVRFAFFCHAVLQAAPQLLPARPTILHAHDWQTGLLPTLLKLGMPGWEGCKSVFTIHNLGYQGLFDKSWVRRLNLPWSGFNLDGFEFYDQLSLLKAGISYADRITTVSAGYAAEIITEATGNGLHGHLSGLGPRLTGIRNGIDTDLWNPATDATLPARYSADDLSGKGICRRAMLAEMGMDPDDDGLVLACISRLAWQKGLDLVAAATPELVQAGARVVILGDGEPGLERAFLALADRHPGRVAAHIGFDRARSHRIEAGADAFLMPSRYEPCGLNQMYSMAYGTVPLVHATGGLRDTVIDATGPALAAGTATGFVFEHADTGGIMYAAARALHMWRERPDIWRDLMRTGMRRDWGWREPAAAYAGLYRNLIAADPS